MIIYYTDFGLVSILCTFYFIDNNKNYRLNYIENDQIKVLNFINKTMFHSLEPNQTRSSLK